MDRILNSLPWTGALGTDFGLLLLVVVAAGFGLAMKLDRRWGWWLVLGAMLWAVLLLRRMGAV